MRHDAYGDTLWAKTFGSGNGYSVQQTDDGGYVITGFIDSFGAGRDDVWLIKTNANGDTMWTKTFAGINFGGGRSVQQTSDGGYIITGTVNFFSTDSADVWLIKTDANGDTTWTKTFGGSNNDEGYSVQQTADSGYVITGYTHSYGAGESDVWLIKTEIDGDTIWTKTFGGSDSDLGRYAQQTADGGYVILGWTRSFGFGAWDVWLIKTDANGDTMWTKTFGGSFEDVGHSLQQTFDGGYIIAGATRSFGTGGYDVWLIRVDADIVSRTSINGYQLQQNYPNPFNPRTIINYRLAFDNFVELAIYNLSGQQIRTLVSIYQPAGSHQVEWDGRDESGQPVASGIYFYQLKAGNDFAATKKMVLLR
jgi:hypothetical protein